MQTVRIFLDSDQIDENVPEDSEDFENPNPSSRLTSRFVGSTRNSTFTRKNLSISEKKQFIESLNTKVKN